MPLVPGPGSEFANFGDRDVLMGLTSDEAWLELTEQDLEVRYIHTHTYILYSYHSEARARVITRIIVLYISLSSLTCIHIPTTHRIVVLQEIFPDPKSKHNRIASS